MGASALFRAFDSAITVDSASTDWETAVMRMFECRNALARHYYDDAGAKGQITCIGSVAKDTATHPLADVDAVFHLPPGTYQRFNDYGGNGQSALLQEVRSILSRRYPRTSIRGDGPAVVVEFTTGPNVEIIPAVLMGSTRDVFHCSGWVPVTRNGGLWEHADYGADFDSIRTLHVSTAGQSGRLIRYMKAWRRLHSAVLKSIVIELMAVDFWESWDPQRTRTGYAFDDWLIRDFLAFAADHYFSTYRMPGSGKAIDTGYGWRDKANKSHENAVKACGHGEDSASYRIYWQEVLGDGFGA